MPTYDYLCPDCGHRWEKFQSMSADPLKECPNCGRESAKRLIGTGAGVIFKGGGFYETDYRNDKYKADAKKDTGDGGGKSDAKGDGKTSDAASKPAESKPAESKPAAKPEPAKATAKDGGK